MNASHVLNLLRRFGLVQKQCRQTVRSIKLTLKALKTKNTFKLYKKTLKQIVCASRIPPTPSWLCGCVAPFSLSLYACETRCFMWSQGKTIVKAYRYERSMQGCENEAKMRSTASEILTNSVPHEQKATIWEPKLPKFRPKSVPKD